MTGGVLIVDDDAGFRRVARRLLESEGLHVVGEAGDGAQARTACAELRPAGVLLDVNLPDVSGRVLAGELAAAHPGLRILLTSTDHHAGVDGVDFVPKTELALAGLADYLA